MSSPLAMGQSTGFDLDRKVSFCTAGAAFSKGDIVTPTALAHDTTGGTRTVVAPTSVSIKYGIHGVIMDNCASGALVQVCWVGEVDAFTQSANAISVIGAYTTYTVRTTKTLDADPPGALPRRLVALALDTSSGVAASATRTLRRVWFDGINGFAMDFGTAGASAMFQPAQLLATPLTTPSAAYASSATISTFAAVTPGTDDINVSLPTNFLNVAGRAILITASGTLGATGTPTLTLTPVLDTAGPTAGTKVALHNLVGTLSTALSGNLWTAQWLASCKTTGATGTMYTACTNGRIAVVTSNDVGAPVTSAAVDLTAALFVKIRPTWDASSASNTTTLDSLYVQRVS
jgi:hypothetical protein